jgi:hypothetical protein
MESAMEHDKSVEQINEKKRNEDYWFFSNKRISDIKIEIKDKDDAILYEKLLGAGKKVKIKLKKIEGKSITLQVWDFFSSTPWITRRMDYKELISNPYIYPKYIFKDQKKKRTDADYFMAKKRLVASLTQSQQAH